MFFRKKEPNACEIRDASFIRGMSMTEDELAANLARKNLLVDMRDGFMEAAAEKGFADAAEDGITLHDDFQKLVNRHAEHSDEPQR